MSATKREFTGKEVTDAIKAACDSLNVPQEMLDIEVLETGSTGIFGLIRKKAKIRVTLKAEATAKEVVQPVEQDTPVVEVDEPAAQKTEVVEEAEATEAIVSEPAAQPAEPRQEEADEDDDDAEAGSDLEPEGEASEEGLAVVKAEIVRLIELMGYPSTVEVKAEGLSVQCSIQGEFEEELAGPEGKTLDAIQYLVRKIVARKTTERMRISVNVGNFRERRLEELKVKAVELATLVRENGKTQVLPALNPSERREIHMVLQEDKEVRSRSVGDGLFKKILIYKPGKGSSRGGRRKPNPRNRRGRGNRNGGNSSQE